MTRIEAERLERIINEQVGLYYQLKTAGPEEFKTAAHTVAWCIGELKVFLSQNGYKYTLDEEKHVHLV